VEDKTKPKFYHYSLKMFNLRGLISTKWIAFGNTRSHLLHQKICVSLLLLFGA